MSSLKYKLFFEGIVVIIGLAIAASVSSHIELAIGLAFADLVLLCAFLTDPGVEAAKP